MASQYRDFKDEDAIAFGTLVVVASVVDDFANPDSPPGVDVDIRRAEQHRFGSEQRCLKVVMHGEVFYGSIGRTRGGVTAA